MLGQAKNLMRVVLRAIGISLYHAGLARAIINRSTRTRTVLYHAVEHQQSSFTRGLGTCVSPDTFALHLDYYCRFYSVVSMKDYMRLQPTKLPQVLITFDDGYASVMDNALPLLEARNLSATVYLIGNAVRGRMIWVNRLNQAMNDFPEQTREVLNTYPGLAKRSRRGVIHRIQTRFTPTQIASLIEQLERSVPDLTKTDVKLFVTPDDIRQMQGRGVSFGFHSNDHWNLGHCKDSELVATLCTQGLDGLIDTPSFAYPFGYFAPSSIGRLSRMGFHSLMTVGSNNERFCKLHINRTEMFEPDFARMFARLEIEEPVVAALHTVYNRHREIALQLATWFAKRLA